MDSFARAPAPPLAASGPTRGAARLLRQQGFSVVAELTLANQRRVDLMGIARDGQVAVVEVKSSVADFRADRKWTDYRDFCDLFYFAVPPDFPLDILPAATGVVIADAYEGHVHRPAPLHPLGPARRKAVLLRFARTAALRLHDRLDPFAALGGADG